MSFQPIAIVGRACVLPGAHTPEALWTAIRDGRDLLESAPADRWGVPAHLALTSDPHAAADRAWSDRGGYVAGWEARLAAEVDGDPFPMGTESLLALDPLFQWVLSTGRSALRAAGHGTASDRAGAVIGNLSFPSSTMSRFAESIWFDRGPTIDPRNRFMSGLPAHLLARELGLGGGAFALDAACASSLYAIKLACDRLHDRTADLMLAGAVCRSDDLFIHVGFCALNAMSRTGRSRPFHAGADGLVPAEGAVMLSLKRLDDAVVAGDHIYGVIRGAGLSNDGRGKGLLAPSSAGQIRAVETAWRQAGLDRRDVSLIECHATGTTVGDAAEIATLVRALGGDRDTPLPIGSLKSNLGHLITAAGAAGILKVLGAMEAGIRPPTLHVDQPHPDLAGTPLRLLTEAEPWESDRPRLAGVSAFGFGGNNAHVILEEWNGAPRPVAAAPRLPAGELAIVSLGARVASGRSTADFVQDLLAGTPRTRPGAPVRGAAHEVTLELPGLRFPPRDLEQTLAQQTLLLAAAREAVSAVSDLPPERTAVLIGCQSDPEVARYGARWRLRGWEQDADPQWLRVATDAVTPVLESAGVVGNMPNIPANRLSSQFDFGGPGFAVASEEASGLAALAIATRSLRAGEIDAALVGAVDLSCEPVHEAAAHEVLPADRRISGDAAVVLVVKRLEDARRAGDRVWAVIPSDAPTPESHLGDGGRALTAQFGHAHAASGLLHLAAAAALAHHGHHLGAAGPAAAGARVTEVRTEALGGQQHRVTLCPADLADAVPSHVPSQRPTLTYPAHPPRIAMPPRAGRLQEAFMDPAPPLPPTHLDSAPADGETGLGVETTTMAPPPRLARITPEAEASPRVVAPQTAVRKPVAPVAPVPMARPAAPVPPPQVSAVRAAPPQAPTSLPEPAARLLALQQQIAAAHQAFVTQQSAIHKRFLAVRQTTLASMAAAATSGGGAVDRPAPSEPVAPRPPEPTPAPIAAPPAAPVAPSSIRVRTPGPVPPTVPAPQQSPPPKPAAPTSPKLGGLAALRPPMPTHKVIPSDLPGPKWDRADLEVLASDKISKVFGPLFARQDDFPRQVRMPKPPLLLADRVTGLDAEPGSMTTGVIWTETDVTEDAWYLHDGRMPAGVMIESGQADLLLISWLGADFQNRGERVYRLLGCTLVYSGGLPQPGETLQYEIHVDGHANQGDTRIFFFHYDCVVDGKPRLTVRNGQAGFFSDEELANSGGILWTPETGDHDASARLDGPVIPCTRRSFTHEQVLAFASGDAYRCFGTGFERLQTHVRTPRIAPPPMSFWEKVTDLDPEGGPWRRGYFRAEQRITPEDWFFQGHFKDDPCMPGTMMFEACLQAMAFYMTSLGYTVAHDGWTFEPVPDVPYDLKCRGQVLPGAENLVYEIFIEEVHDGPWPTLYADFLCTIDGLKAFHARRVGLRLRPDWPLTSRPEILADYVEPKPVATVDGFEFGYRSLIACAWGLPSEAFGPMYRPFDTGRPCARLPGPPYHFMSRLTRIDGPIGGMEVGTEIALEYDIPEDAWYFDENGNRTMPYAVLLEAALQPCGWIACYIGSALTTDEDLYFRNLDGTATWMVECLPDAGTLTTRAKITNISLAGGMIIEGFEVACFLGDTQIYDMKTVFGFFPRESLANQIGMPPTPAEREVLHAPSDFLVDLTTRPHRYCGGPLRLPAPMLLMLDRVTGYWPTGGSKGLGKLRSEKDVRPAEWFFKAHFYSDPVQPGSLGIEAMIQLLQFYMLHENLHEGMAHPRFEPLMLDQPLTWKYRGQVVPENETIRVEMDIVEVGHDSRGAYAICDAYLWVDELRIYQAIGMGMRIVDGGGFIEEEETLDPARDTWVNDHCPTWVLPSLPAMSMVDRLASAAQRAIGGHVLEVQNVTIHGWVKVDQPVRLKPVLGERREDPAGTAVDVALLVWRDRPDARLSRFEEAATGTIVLGSSYPAAPQDLAPLTSGEDGGLPYETGALFHGPSFQSLSRLKMGSNGSSATLDVARCAVPRGALHPGLLDGLLHAIPHDDLARWSDAIPTSHAAYPHTIERLSLYAAPPSEGAVQVEARFLGLTDGPHGQRLPRTRVQASVEGALWLELDLVEILLPKGPIGEAAPADRVAFLRDRQHVPDLALSERTPDGATADTATIRATDWLPGTVRAVYGPATDDLTADVAVKDAVAARTASHPSLVRHDGTHATTLDQPYRRFPVTLTREGGAVSATLGAPQLDIQPVEDHWAEWFGRDRWPVADLYYGMIRRFMGSFHVEDPAAHEAIRGRSILYLANHQVMYESLAFSIVASGFHGVNTVTLAKVEHRTSWLGRLIAHCFAYPGARDPEVITFFDRARKGDLQKIVAGFARDMVSKPGKSVLVHVEGTRSLESRTPVQKMSGAFIDLALHTGAPIVPVRFAGALPETEAPHRLEFPLEMARQDVYLGAPILPETLASLPLKERKAMVLNAINAPGPDKASELPNTPDLTFAASVRELATRHDLAPPYATLLAVLRELPDPTPITRAIVESLEGTRALPRTDAGLWAETLRTEFGLV